MAKPFESTAKSFECAFECAANCSCPHCLERDFKDTLDLAALYLKVRKQIEVREHLWLAQDIARQARRDKKRDLLDRLIFRIDLESKRRSPSKDTFSI